MNREEYVLKPFRDKEDEWKERARAGIERHRKGALTLRVLDEAGNAVPGAAVSVKQVSHDFKYGANIFMLDEFETPEKNAIYREAFKEYFNMATLPFYWNTLEPEEGRPRFAADSPRIYRRPAPDLCLDYCEANGIAMKGHCLHYDHFTPEWMKKYDVRRQWLKLEERFRRIAERYAARIPGWEVTNESFWSRYETPMYLDPEFMEKSFKLAERYFPANELIANEGGEIFRDRHFYYTRERYLMQLERARLKGARIDAIGFQYHVWSTPETEAEVVATQYDPVRMYAVFDTCRQMFGLPMQITEITLPCFDPASREAENLQAEVLKNLYTIWFGVEGLEAVIYWNLVDGYAFKAEPGDFTAGENKLAGGLMRFDMTPKPALRELRRLFTEEWHTEASLVTDEGGCARLRGFYGRYDVQITCGGRQVTRQIHLQKIPDASPCVDIRI